MSAPRRPRGESRHAQPAGAAGRPAAGRRTPRGAPDPRATIAAHHEDGPGPLFGIAELCAEFGLTPRALRFYEDKGLLSPRRINGTRVYTRRDRARVALIQRSKAIGASLAEIEQYLGLYGAHGEGRVQQLRWVLERTDAAIAQLEQKLAHIEATLAELRLINRSVRSQLDGR